MRCDGMQLTMRFRRLCVLLLSLASSTFGQVAHGGTIPTVGTTSGSSLTSGNWSISGSNLTIAVGLTYSSTTVTVSSVSWSLGSGAAIQINSDKNNGGAGSDVSVLWCIPAPTSGTGTVTVTLSSAPSGSWTFNADYFTGADQTTPCPTGDSVVNHTATNSYTLTPGNLTANDASFSISADGSANISSVSPNQTFLSNATAVDIATGYNAGTGSIAVTMSDSNDAHSNVAARIKAAGGGGAIASGPSKRRKLELIDPQT